MNRIRPCMWLLLACIPQLSLASSAPLNDDQLTDRSPIYSVDYQELSEPIIIPETKSFGQRSKDYFIDHIATPLYIQYDRITNLGCTKRDIAVATAALVALYGAKKAADHYHLLAGLRARDFTDTRAVISHDAKFAWNYKGRIALGAGAVIACGLLIKSVLNLPIIERFKRSLTSEQKQLISSDENLLELINRAHEDPKALADHSHKIPLAEHQKKLLTKAVEKHKSDIDPLSLFDDLL